MAEQQHSQPATNPKDLTGQRFGRLVAIELASPAPYGNRRWKVRCDCGKEKLVVHSCLTSGNTKSCGCLREEINLAVHWKHGLSKTPEYQAWQGMHHRCKPNGSEKDRRNYFDRGIRVCEEWCGPDGFKRFLSFVGARPSPKHSLDRIDNRKGYGPGNVRWATRNEQMRNKRSNRLIRHAGKVQCITAWTEELGFSKHLIRDRLRSGWSVKRALTSPSQRKNNSESTPSNERART